MRIVSLLSRWSGRSRQSSRRALWRLIAGCGLIVYAGWAQAAFDHSHEVWDFLLKRSVVLNNENKASVVRYNRLAGNERLLDGYLESLSAVSRAEYEGWSRAEQLAFLINAHNAYAAKLVLSHYPGVESIHLSGPAWPQPPWHTPFFTLLGQERSLDGLSRELLRSMGEPGAHFALTCACVGGPMLREEAYVPERLEHQLQEQAERFLSDRSRNRYDDARQVLTVSPLFADHAEDFARAKGSVKAYLAEYADLFAQAPATQAVIAGQRYTLEFLPHDRRLNDAR